MNKVQFSDLINFDNTAILEAFKEIIAAYSEMIAVAKKSSAEIAAQAAATAANSDANKEKLEQALAEMKALQAQTKAYQKTLADLEAQNKKLKEQSDEKAKAEKAEIDRLKAIEDLSKQRARAFEKQFAAQQKANDKAKEEAEIMGKQARSIAELAKQTAILSKQRREMDKYADPKKFEVLTNAIAANNKKLKEFDGDIGNYQRNVGDYQKAWEGMPGALGATGQAAGGVGQAFKALLANPIVALFAALAAALGALVNAFMKTERGAALLRKGTAFLDASMSKLIDISNALVDAIIFAFEKPKEALASFGKGIKEYVTDRIKNAFDMFKNFGSFVKNVWSGDMDKAAESAKKFGANVLDAVTMGAGKAVLDGMGNLSKEVNATAAAFEKLALQQLQNEKLNQRLSLSIEKLRVEEQLLIDAADNDKLAFEDRLKAAEEYAVVAQKRAEQTRTLANANVSIIQKELELNKNNAVKTRELNQTLTDAKLAQIQAEGELVTTRRDSLEKIQMLDRDYFEQRLDYAIDYGAAYIAANQAEIGLTTTTAEKRKTLLAETQAYLAQNWEQQKRIIEAQAVAAGGQINLEAMLAEKDAEKVQRMAEAAKLDEVEKNRVLQTLVARKAALSSLAGLEQTVADKQKADVKALFDAEKLAFDKKQELKQLELEGSKKTSTEKSKAEIALQIETYEKMLSLASEYPGQIADTEVALIKQKLTNAKTSLSEKGGESFDIWALLGFSGEGKEDGKMQKMKQMFSDTVSAVTSFFTQMADARVEAATRAVEASQKELDSAQSYADEQNALKDQGLANYSDDADKRLQIAKDAQAAALAEQEAAAKKKAQIESVSQTISLVSAVANIWKSATELGPIGWVLAGIQTAALFGSFLLAKKTAKDATKIDYHDGGVFDIGGGTHASGNDTTIANTKGTQRRAERGEKVGVLTPFAARRYGRQFESFVSLANKGVLERAFGGMDAEMQGGGKDYTGILSAQNGYLATIANSKPDRVETAVVNGVQHTYKYKGAHRVSHETIKL